MTSKVFAKIQVILKNHIQLSQFQNSVSFEIAFAVSYLFLRLAKKDKNRAND
jgi:hypothetical protein